MKKFIKQISVITVLTLFATMLIGFTGCINYPELGELSKEEKVKIEHDYFDTYLYGEVTDEKYDSSISIDNYLGTYSGNSVIIISDINKLGVDVPTDLIVDDMLVLTLPNGAPYVCLHVKAENEETKFYNLNEAYESGLLTKDDLQQISLCYKNIVDGNAEPMGDLSEEAKNEIYHDYVNRECMHYYLIDNGHYFFGVDNYWGKYDGKIVFGCGGGSDVMGETNIGGIRFVTRSGEYKYWVYEEAKDGGIGKFTSLEDAYKNGDISKNQLKTIAHYANS